MSQRPTDGGSRDSRSPGGEIARWGIRAWLAGSVLGWVVIACAAGAAMMLGLLVVLGVVTTTVSDDLRDQCGSAVGPDPSASARPTRAATPAVTPAGEPADDFPTPTANPYASLELSDRDSEYQAACASAMKEAPYQLPPLGDRNDGPEARCAARLADGLEGHRVEQASLVRFVVYHASAVSISGCEPPPATDLSADAGGFVVDLPSATGCPDQGTAMLLPDTVVEQGVCGQRVDPDWVSAGDLVFWGHDATGPSSVGIAVGEGRLVSTDAATGYVVPQGIPEGDDVRVKRILQAG